MSYRNSIVKIAILYAVLLVVACNSQSENLTSSWQEAFEALLIDNHAEERISECGNFSGTDRFFLHDIDMDGIPELIVLNSIDEIAYIYTFRRGKALLLDYDEEDIPIIALLHGAARSRIRPSPENMPGFVFMWIGPSAGSFGTSSYYNRVVIDGESLIIADYGEWYIDIDTLHKLFDNFGSDADENILNAAIKEHTHFYINGNTVSQEELFRVFGRDEQPFQLYAVTIDNISEIIFRWKQNHQTQ